MDTETINQSKVLPWNLARGVCIGHGYEVVVDAELVAGDGSAPYFYGVAPALGSPEPR